MGVGKRMFAGVAVGTTVFGAVLGMAAGLDVSSGETIGSGEAEVASCDQDGVQTSYVFDGSTGNVTAIKVEFLDDYCDEATVTVAASHFNSGSLITGSSVLRTYTEDQTILGNSITVPLDTPIAAEVFDTVNVTLHGGHAPVLPFFTG